MTDVFRKIYKGLPTEKNELVLAIKNKAEELYELMNNINSREMSVAKTNLETTIMWATKAVILSAE